MKIDWEFLFLPWRKAIRLEHELANLEHDLKLEKSRINTGSAESFRPFATGHPELSQISAEARDKCIDTLRDKMSRVYSNEFHRVVDHYLENIPAVSEGGPYPGIETMGAISTVDHIPHIEITIPAWHFRTAFLSHIY